MSRHDDLMAAFRDALAAQKRARAEARAAHDAMMECEDRKEQRRLAVETLAASARARAANRRAADAGMAVYDEAVGGES